VSNAAQPDQATTPWFKALLLIQVVVGGLFGVIPFLAPQVAADAASYTGAEPFVYRLAGAAALGYALAAALALAAPAWYRFKITAAATYVFNAGAVVAALITLFEGDRNFWVWFILFAALAFVVILIYVTRRNEGPPAPAEPRLDQPARVLLILATIAATFFGLAPLFAASFFAEFGGFDPSDLFVYRLAGAGTLGYAFGGYMSIKDGRWEAMRLQNLAAIVFNGFSAIAALMYVLAGGSSVIGWLILVAAIGFTIGLLVLHSRHGRLSALTSP
jgi:MFS family permease